MTREFNSESRDRASIIRCCQRRALLKRAMGAALYAGLLPCAAVAAVTDPRKLPPQIGDELVYPSWEQEDHTIAPDDIVQNAPPILGYPRNPATGVVRERSRLNQILLVRFDDAALDDATRARSAEGIVAYSGVCTHTGCGVSEWNDAALHFVCPCHGSEFDPRTHASIIGGPATRPLPGLPIALRDGILIVSGSFTDKVGADEI